MEINRAINMLTEIMKTHETAKQMAIAINDTNTETLERGYLLGLDRAIETLKLLE